MIHDRSTTSATTSFRKKYETATNNTAQRVFPGETVKDCFFHFIQCILRKAQTILLHSYYKENEAMTQVKRRAEVLPLVPPKLVEEFLLKTLKDVGELATYPLQQYLLIA